MRREQTFTPEQEALFWAIQVDGDMHPHLRDFLHNVVDWGNLRRMAVKHGILPLVYRRLKALEQNPAPAAEMAEFRNLYLANAGANLAKELKLLKLLDLLSDNGIEAAVFKGPVLALQAYGDPSHRQYNDLDILIRRRDFRAAYSRLTAAGYAPQFPIDDKRENWLIRSNIELKFVGQDNVPVELHWEICERSGYFGIGTDAVWENLDTVNLHGSRIRVPAPEDTLIMLWLHGFRHHWDNLKLVADLIRMSGVCRQRGRREIDTACGKLPAAYQYRFMRDILNPRLLAHSVFFPRSYQKTRDRFSDMAAEVFTPKPTDWLAVDLPDILYPLYYLIRPLRLVLKYCGMALLTAGKRRILP